MQRNKRHKQRGAALISALLIVSVMSVVAVSIMDTIRFSARLSTNIADRDQARLYAVAAEELAKSTIRQAWRADSTRNPVLDQWTQAPLTFPIPEGLIEGGVRDGANCFNLNSVVSSGEGGFRYDELGAARFEHFLEQFGVPTAESALIAAELADWIDTDDQASFGGAEDDYYLGLDSPYRTGGQFMADPSELRALRTMTPSLYETIRPLICTRPTNLLQPINLNTLQDWQAPLLAAYLGQTYDTAIALQLLIERPVGGYGAVSDFFEQAIREPETFTEAARERFALISNAYEVAATIRFRDATVAVTSTLQISDAGDITTLSRRYGPIE
ncbi:MAG: type II secretion system minor pseudopilin GspK [Pseudomonadota bacterium]